MSRSFQETSGDKTAEGHTHARMAQALRPRGSLHPRVCGSSRDGGWGEDRWHHDAGIRRPLKCLEAGVSCGRQGCRPPTPPVQFKDCKIQMCFHFPEPPAPCSRPLPPGISELPAPCRAGPRGQSSLVRGPGRLAPHPRALGGGQRSHTPVCVLESAAPTPPRAGGAPLE